MRKKILIGGTIAIVILFMGVGFLWYVGGKTAASKLASDTKTLKVDQTDSDKDGLADELEKVLGTNEVKMDTDDDGFDDKAELENGFNPAGEGKWSSAPAEKYKNTLVLAKKDGLSYIWYVAANGKRYYMGASDNEFKYLLASPYWNTK